MAKSAVVFVANGCEPVEVTAPVDWPVLSFRSRISARVFSGVILESLMTTPAL